MMKDLLSTPEVKRDITVVSLKTTTYKRGNSLFLSKQLTTLKRKSHGYDVLNESVTEEIDDMNIVEGIHTLPDGEYILTFNDISKNYLDTYDEFYGYKLFPYGVDNHDSKHNNS